MGATASRCTVGNVNAGWSPDTVHREYSRSPREAAKSPRQGTLSIGDNEGRFDLFLNVDMQQSHPPAQWLYRQLPGLPCCFSQSCKVKSEYAKRELSEDRDEINVRMHLEDGLSAASSLTVHSLTERTSMTCLRPSLAASHAALIDGVEETPLTPPVDVHGWLKRGELELKRRHWQSAKDAFTVAVDMEPTLAQSWAGRGHALLQMGRYAEALEDLAEAINLDPMLSKAISDRSEAKLRLYLSPAVADAINGGEETPDPKEIDIATHNLSLAMRLGCVDAQDLLQLAAATAAATKHGVDT